MKIELLNFKSWVLEFIDKHCWCRFASTLANFKQPHTKHKESW